MAQLRGGTGIRFARRRIGNLFQAVILLAALLGLLFLIAWMLVGTAGFLILALTAVPLLISGATFGPPLVLKMYQAVPIRRDEAPDFHDLADELARRAGLAERPILCYIPSRALLAFSVGLKPHGAIAFSDGMLRLLSRTELRGVLAHEIGHIVGRDTRVMGLADLVNQLVSALAGAGQLLILLNLPLYLLTDASLPWGPLLLMAMAPMVTALLQLGLSRSREFEADLMAVRLTGDPYGLAMALQRIEAAESLSLGRIFGIGRGVEVPSVLRTHPATGQRVARLMELAEGSGQRDAGGQRRGDGHSGYLPHGVAEPREGPRKRGSGFWY